MPNNVKTIDTTALDTLPEDLFSAYSVSTNRRIVISEYPDGSCQRNSDVTSSKRSWRFSKKLTASRRNTLNQFYLAHVGKPFWFRDVHAGMKFTGVFTSGWRETGAIGRSQVSLEVEEVY